MSRTTMSQRMTTVDDFQDESFDISRTIDLDTTDLA
jgi:hypothetical protein